MLNSVSDHYFTPAIIKGFNFYYEMQKTYDRHIMANHHCQSQYGPFHSSLPFEHLHHVFRVSFHVVLKDIWID